MDKQKINNNLKKILPYLKNKYVITIFVFIFLIMFVDENSVLSQYKLNEELNNLRSQNEYYIKQIRLNKQRLKQLKTNKENLEKFAREQYLMKAPNEDIYVIIEE